VVQKLYGHVEDPRFVAGRSLNSVTLPTMYDDQGPRTVLRLEVSRAAVAMPKPALLISQAEVEGALRGGFCTLGGKTER
jgi:4,5-epoxidase